MDARRYLMALRRSALLIAVLAVFGGLLALGVSKSQPPQYRSTATVFFQVQGADNAGALLQGSNYAQSQARSFAVLAVKPLVLSEVIQELGLDESTTQLARRLTVSVPLETVMVDITASASTPEDAQVLAQATAEQLVRTVEALSKKAGSTSTSAIDATVVGPAQLPSFPYKPNTKLNVALGLLLGFALGVAVAIVRELLHNRVSDSRALSEVTDLPILGQIPLGAGRQTAPPKDRRQVEAYRWTATNVDFVNHTGDVRALVVSSANAGEGKTSLATNLGMLLSESRRVVLVDCDLRRPRLAQLLGLEAGAGVTTLVTGRATLADVIQPTAGGLDVITSGPTPPNPVGVISSEAFAEMISTLRASYDLVIVDAPPLLPVTDAALLAQIADGAILAVDARHTTRNQLSRAIEHLRLVDAEIFGVVLTMARLPRGSQKYYTAKPTSSSPTN